MTAQKVKEWIIALLEADSAVIGNFENGSDDIKTGNDTIPSDEGVYVRVLTSAPTEARGFESVDVRIMVVKLGETECYAAALDVQNALNQNPGCPTSFGIQPSSSDLSVRKVSRVTLQSAPEPIGNDNSYGAVLSIQVVGRSGSSPD